MTGRLLGTQFSGTSARYRMVVRMGLTVFDERAPVCWNYRIVDVGAYGWHQVDMQGIITPRVDSIVLSNDDSVDHVVCLGIDASGGTLQVGQVNVPAGAGFGTGPAIDLVAAAMPTTVVGFVLIHGASCSVRTSEDAVTGGVNLVMFGGQV